MWILKVPSTYDANDLKRSLREVAAVVDAELFLDAFGRPMGVARLRFATPLDAQRCSRFPTAPPLSPFSILHFTSLYTLYSIFEVAFFSFELSLYFILPMSSLLNVISIECRLEWADDSQLIPSHRPSLNPLHVLAFHASYIFLVFYHLIITFIMVFPYPYMVLFQSPLYPSLESGFYSHHLYSKFSSRLPNTHHWATDRFICAVWLIHILHHQYTSSLLSSDIVHILD